MKQKSIHRILLYLFILIVSSPLAFSQNRRPDVLTKKDNSRIETVILELDDVVIKYKKFSDPSGPTFTIKKSDVVSILYGNGEEEVLNKVSDRTQPPVKESNANHINNLSHKKQKLLNSYQPNDHQKLLADIRKYKRRANTGKVLGTILGTASVAILTTGIIQFTQADNNALRDQQALVFSESGGWEGGFYYRYLLDHHMDVGMPFWEESSARSQEISIMLRNGQINQAEANYRFSQLQQANREQNAELGRPLWFSDKKSWYQTEAKNYIYASIGGLGLTTAVFLLSGSSGWKYKVLRQEARTKGLTVKFEPQWQAGRNMGIRLTGTF